MRFHLVLSKRNYVVLSDGHAILLNFLFTAEPRLHLDDFCIIPHDDKT